MKIVIDTNIVIDYFADREPFADFAEQIFELCDSELVEGYFTANTITDIYYILRKIAGDLQTREHIKTISAILNIVDVTGNDIMKALESHMTDFEDALLSECAKRIRADYIVTRNTRDFIDSPVIAIEPADFINTIK